MINHMVQIFEGLSLEDIEIMHKQALGAKQLAQVKNLSATVRLWDEILDKLTLVLEAKREQ